MKDPLFSLSLFFLLLFSFLSFPESKKKKAKKKLSKKEKRKTALNNTRTERNSTHLVDRALVPAEVLQVLDPLEERDGDAAAVRVDVGQDRHPPLSEDAVA